VGGAAAAGTDCTDCLDLPIGTPLLSAPAGDRLGESVDVLGERAVFGAPSPFGNGYVETAELIGGAWQATTATNSPSPQLDEQFGDAVALAGDLLVVGAPKRDIVDQIDAGRVSIFSWNGSTWVHETDLTQPGGPEADARFGDAVDLWHDSDSGAYRLIVGAPGSSFFNPDALPGEPENPTAGQAFIFESTDAGLTWTPQATLNALSAFEPPILDQDLFGSAVAIDGDVAAIGAPSQATDTGRAYVAEFDGASGTWTLDNDDVIRGFASGDDLGTAVAVQGGTVAVGVPGADAPDDGIGGGPGIRTGTVRIVEQDAGGEWTTVDNVSPEQVVSNDGVAYGFDVRFAEGSLIVAAPATTPGSTADPLVEHHARLPDGSFVRAVSLAPAATDPITNVAAGTASGVATVAYGAPLPSAAGDSRGFVTRGPVPSPADPAIPPCPVDDWNGNGIADVCEIGAGLLEDCDDNGRPDARDIEEGLAADCDGNGVIDSCELHFAEIVWLIDPSGSTGTKGDAFCGPDGITTLVEAELEVRGWTVDSTALFTVGSSSDFTCVAEGDSVVARYGDQVPFRDPAGFGGVSVLADPESWAAASAIVADAYPWRSRLRIVVPISDECAWQGSNTPAECNDDDEDSIDAAWAFLACRDVFAFPIQTPLGTTLLAEATDQMEELALRTSGQAFQILDPESQVDRDALVAAFVAEVEHRAIVHDFDPVTDGPGDGVLDVYQIRDEIGPAFDDCNRNGISDRAEILLGDPAFGPGDPVPPVVASVEDEDGSGTLDICDGVVCPTDFDGSGETEFQDLLTLLSAFGPCGTPCPADVNGDGVVDLPDLLATLNGWGDCYQVHGPTCTIQALDAESPPQSVLDCLQKAGWDPVLAAPCIDAILLTQQP